jgi:hypothetical protein
MTTDYKPNSLAIKVIRLFLADRKLVASAERLADMFGTTPKNIRQTMAPAIGRDILRKEFNDLTGDQDYAAGRRLDQMKHLLSPVEAEPVKQETRSQAESCEHWSDGTVDHGDGAPTPWADTEIPANRINLDDLHLCDIPAPIGRAGAISRYDGHFREALESGRAITMPPDYVNVVAKSARSWVKRHAASHAVKQCERMAGGHIGAVWIVKAGVGA